MNITKIIQKTAKRLYNRGKGGNVQAVIDYATKGLASANCHLEYCSGCESEMPVVNNSHDCLVCGSTTTTLNIKTKQPDYLGVFTYPNAFIYCDTTKERNGDFLEIARIYFRPLSIKIMTTNTAKYEDAILIAQAEYEKMKANIDTPIVVSGTGQTVLCCL